MDPHLHVLLLPAPALGLRCRLGHATELGSGVLVHTAYAGRAQRLYRSGMGQDRHAWPADRPCHCPVIFGHLRLEAGAEGLATEIGDDASVRARALVRPLCHGWILFRSDLDWFGFFAGKPGFYGSASGIWTL